MRILLEIDQGRFFEADTQENLASNNFLGRGHPSGEIAAIKLNLKTVKVSEKYTGYLAKITVISVT